MLKHPSIAVSVVATLLSTVQPAAAVSFTASSVGPNTWTYTLTYDPLDNYSIFQPSTTITLTGLSGVTSAGGPTSTDFPNPALDALNLQWTPQVLDSGTRVVWTHIGSGTGNFSSPLHVFGFSVTAPGAQNGTVTYGTDGFSRDVTNPLPGNVFELDVVGSVAGPVSATAVPEPATLALVAVGLVTRGLTRRRQGGR